MKDLRIGVTILLLLSYYHLTGQFEVSTDPAIVGTSTGSIHLEAQQEEYRGRETRAMITELFQKVAGRGLEEVYEDEVVVRYI